MNFYDIISLLAILFLITGAIRDINIVRKKKKSHYLKKLEAAEDVFLKTKLEFSEITNYSASLLQVPTTSSARQKDYLDAVDIILSKDTAIISRPPPPITYFPKKYQSHPAIKTGLIDELLGDSLVEYKNFTAISKTRIDQFSFECN